MKKKDRFKITEFKNPRSSAFRVYGRTPDGTVVRENFKDYAHALARKQELEIDAINSPVVLIMQPTRLRPHSDSRTAGAALRSVQPEH